MKIIYLIIASNDPIHETDRLAQEKTWLGRIPGDEWKFLRGAEGNVRRRSRSRRQRTGKKVTRPEAAIQPACGHSCANRLHQIGDRSGSRDTAALISEHHI